MASCIDPYVPDLQGYDSLLSVDALITDSETPGIVRLTMTMQNHNEIPPAVSDASVILTDDTGNNSTLINTGNGIYKTDSTKFRASSGRTYILHITTKDGKEYESEPCPMFPVADIDSINFAKDQKIVNNGTQALDGVSIYVNSKEGSDNQYYRWSYEETWKFKVPYPSKFDYLKNPDDGDHPSFREVSKLKEFGWKSNQSRDVIIKSMNGSGDKRVRNQSVTFIPTGLTDRLLIQYSILVSQYSISKAEYEFWSSINNINEAGNDIFAKQPYSVQSNIHCKTKPEERVLGYFQVSAVSRQRKYILYRDVASAGLPFYSYPCVKLVLDKSWLPPPCKFCPPPKWDDLYWHFCIANDYAFVEPLYLNVSDVLTYLVFTRPECADCELTGTSVRPDFWIDLQ